MVERDKKYCRQYYIEELKYDVNAVSRRIIGKNIFFQKYKRDVLSKQKGNSAIYQAIIDGKPFMAGRYGGNELHTVADILFEKKGGKIGGLSKHVRSNMTNVAGFFPDEKEMYCKFQEVYTEAAASVDYLAVWDMFFQAEIAERFSPNAKFMEFTAIEPFYFDNPWSKALEGKKVLVIHPFEDTIQKQYKKRKFIFDNENVLPEFELVTMKSVQTLAGIRDPRFSNWFEALEYMTNQALQYDFDIALVGCGAYGFPLAANIKKAGKQVIHMGGALQIMFGIKGKRWDNHEIIGKMYNDAWVRPGENEKVCKPGLVEKGCYW